MIPPSRDTFGHEPFEWEGFVICRRCCIEHKHYTETIAWPCMSAIVLGLVPRPGDTS